MGILRILLALAVVSTHSSPVLGLKSVGGLTAVQSFYVISGFYMGLVLNTKYNYAGSYRPFLVQRFLRLYPLYAFILVLSILFCVLVGLCRGETVQAGVDWTRYSTHLSPLAWLWLTIPQVTLLGQDAIMFTGLNPTTAGTLHPVFVANFQRTAVPSFGFLFVPQAWSLSLELMFYILAPMLCRWRVRNQLAVVLASVALRIVIYKVFKLNYDPWSYRFFPCELALFTTGSLLYQAYARFHARLTNQWVLAGVLIALIAFMLSYEFLPLRGKMYCYFALLCVGIPCSFALTKNNKLDRFVAELSYPLYLSHMLVIGMVGVFFPHLPTVWQGTVVAVLSILMAWLLCISLEKYFERFRERLFNQHNRVNPKLSYRS